MRLCLNGIVKNESGRIERMLDSVTDFITAYAIVDTGSTDDTKERITEYFKSHHVPGEISEAPFLNWSQARNAGLALGRRIADKHAADYLLLIDADMELRVVNREKFFEKRNGPSYDMFQHGGSLQYLNRRLMHAKFPGEYVGVTHEYLDIPAAGMIPQDVAYFVDHGDGANRPNKFRRDIKLLKDGLRVEPNNARYMFYLAQSYKDGGQPMKAIEWYRKRIAAGGWDEEVWQAQLSLAYCYKDVGDLPQYVFELIKAHDMRPSRAESTYALARYFRENSMNAASVIFAEAGMQIPKSKDALFVDDYQHTLGHQDEFSICAFYLAEKRKKGLEVTNKLALQRSPYVMSREMARNNLYFYLPKLQELCPSFMAQKIAWAPSAEWNPLNPSVTFHNGRMLMNIRTVNYKIDEHGRYCRFLDGEWKYHDDWVTYPIRTRNYIAEVAPDLSLNGKPVELLPPGNIPEPLFKPVLGFEDVRIFSYDNDLWSSATVREMAADGYCEQVRARCDAYPDCWRQVNWKKMLRAPRLYEKNWAPLVDGDTLRFVYRLGEMVDENGQTTHKYDTGQETDHISGGSQYIPFEMGWLGLVHEARPMPGREGVRYYFHRFVFLGTDFKVAKISWPFVFNDKVVEFAAGLCWHPMMDRLVISFGYKDNEAWIGSIGVKDVSKLLWFDFK